MEKLFSRDFYKKNKKKMAIFQFPRIVSIDG